MFLQIMVECASRVHEHSQGSKRPVISLDKPHHCGLAGYFRVTLGIFLDSLGERWKT